MYNFKNNLIILMIILGSTMSHDDSTHEDNVLKERIHIQKCREYQSHVYDYISVLSLIADGESKKIRIDKCGISAVALVVGGISVHPKEFPHMALIGFDSGNNTINWSCGGTLISDRYILTAAHCTYSRSLGEPQFVRLGELDINSDTDDAKPKDYNIKKIIIHPNYKLSSKYNDIALIALNENVDFNSYIRPACLPTEFDSSNENIIATGWGKTKWLGTSSSHLQKVNLQKFNNTECNKLYTNHINFRLIDGIRNETQICAGSRTESKDTCQGDSGGPLQVYHNTEYCMYTTIGITSFGIKCGAGTPGVYTRVFPYVDWIENTVWKN